MQQDLPLGARFSIIGRCFKQQFDRRVKALGLTGVQFGVLNALRLLERSGAEEIRQCDLEKFIHVTHPTMTEIIKRLERSGYISCCRSEHDRRSKSIRSTALARLVFDEIKTTECAVASQLCCGLSERQMSELIHITDVILDNASLLKGDDCC